MHADARNAKDSALDGIASSTQPTNRRYAIPRPSRLTTLTTLSLRLKGKGTF